jgi:uncharacterized cupin superfamily protein
VKKRAAADKARAVRTTTRSVEGFFEPFNVEDVAWKKMAGSLFKRLGRFGGGSHVGVGLDVLKPRQYSNRYHYHLFEEEHVFILKGAATLILGERRYRMKERDYCCFPAGQKAGHHLYNHSSEICVFMTIGEHKPDEIVCFPRTGKAKIRATGKAVPIASLEQSDPAAAGRGRS